MSFSRPIQWYHSHADPIWPDGTFKPERKEMKTCSTVSLHSARSMLTMRSYISFFPFTPFFPFPFAFFILPPLRRVAKADRMLFMRRSNFRNCWLRRSWESPHLTQSMLANWRLGGINIRAKNVERKQISSSCVFAFQKGGEGQESRGRQKYISL